MGADGISMPMILLTAIVSFLAVVGSWGIEKQIKGYMALILLLETGMMGVFCALDFFLFYVFWEVMLLPMYFLIGIWGGPRREYAAIKFFLYTLLGSVLMLLVMLALYFNTTNPETGGHTFNMLHYMQQRAHNARIRGFASPMAVLGAINIVYGALCAMAQSDLKKLVAYSSISHMGFCLLGMAALTPAGMVGAAFQMFSHGMITSMLFFLVVVVYDRSHHTEIDGFRAAVAGP